MSSTELSPEKTRDKRGSGERALETLSDHPPAAREALPFPVPDPPLPGVRDGEFEGEADLYAYLDRATGPKPGGFPPLEALSARLGEFTAAVHHAEVFKDPAADGLARGPKIPQAEALPASGFPWFEQRFGELKELLTLQQSEKGTLVSINAKLAEILSRVDSLSAAMPGENTLAAVETQLTELSRSLDMTREQSAFDADRISRAAREILEATERAEDARAGFEHAARHTVRELGQTVVVAASHAAAVTAEHFSAFIHSGDAGGFSRVESELRALKAQSREGSEQTTAALERVHETLRQFLERGTPNRPSEPPARKRAGVHMPIAADAPAYSRRDSNFGSEPARKPQLDTITLRTPPPPNPSLIKAPEEARERHNLTKKPRPSDQHAQAQCASEPLPLLSGSIFREEEKALPLFGLSIVAVVLLIASAALYYLHAKAQLPPFHLTVAPQVQTVIPASVHPRQTPPGWSSAETGPDKLLASGFSQIPALFTAAEQGAAPTPAQQDPAEDLQRLTDAASRGDRDAQFRIGARFLNDGSLQGGDPATAARWLARAAEQGHTESQFVLASLYERGVGVAKDVTKARELYRKAASAGHIRAMHNLGVLLSAQDTPEDYDEAARWFSNAATAGLTDSQFNLALLYERGLGVPQDNKKAYFWYQVASLAGDKEAAQHAERLKGLLPPSETEATAEQAGSWHPIVEQLPRLAGGSARG